MPDTWEALEHECKNCRECSLCETRTNVVFGVGSRNAEVLFIGEGPGANEDAQGEEQDACIGYLRRQAALLRPKIIVCLGRIAAMRIIKPDFKITREHGQWFEKGGIQMMAVYHPAALLRDPRRRPETFEDFKALQRKINELCERTHANS